MTATLRETASILKSKNIQLDVFLDEVQGEEDVLSVYRGAEEDNIYVDVFLNGEEAEFWHEGLKRNSIKAVSNGVLAEAIVTWLNA